MKCKKCGSEYDGRLKECPDCEKATDEASLQGTLPTLTDTTEDDLAPSWCSWNQTAGGEEIFPGWVLNNRVLYCVGTPLSEFALDLMHNAFGVRCENRRPVMGDADFVSCVKAVYG